MPFDTVDVPEAQALVARATCSHAQLGPVIGEMFNGLIVRYPDAEMIEAPRVYYTRWSETDCDVEAAVIVDPSSVPGASLTTYPARRAVVSVHQGEYEGLPDTWMRLWAEVKAAGIQPAPAAPWDSYEIGAMDTPEVSEWITELYIPIS